MQFYLSDGFTVSRLPAITPTLNLNYMEITYNEADVKFFVGSQVSSTKKCMRKETNSASCVQKKYDKLRTMPSQ